MSSSKKDNEWFEELQIELEAEIGDLHRELRMKIRKFHERLDRIEARGKFPNKLTRLHEKKDRVGKVQQRQQDYEGDESLFLRNLNILVDEKKHKERATKVEELIAEEEEKQEEKSCNIEEISILDIDVEEIIMEKVRVQEDLLDEESVIHEEFVVEEERKDEENPNKEELVVLERSYI